jgi:hypothetical protein
MPEFIHMSNVFLVFIAGVAFGYLIRKYDEERK